MFKKLLVVIALLLFVSVSALACEIPAGTKVAISTPQGWVWSAPFDNRHVEPMPEQPTAEQLRKFSEMVDEDWTDSVEVIDEDAGLNVLVHENDLINCEDKETKKSQ